MLRCYRCKKKIANYRGARVYFIVTHDCVYNFEITHRSCWSRFARHADGEETVSFLKLDEWLNYWDLLGWLFVILQFIDGGQRTIKLYTLRRVVTNIVNEIDRLEKIKKSTPVKTRTPKEERQLNKDLKAIFGRDASTFTLLRRSRRR